jgi:predicted TIM-barrel fold metal-dependent hydrolase
MFYIDSHMHAKFNGLSIKDIIKYLDKERIDACWLLTWEEVNPGHWEYTHLSIETVYQAHLEYPTRIIPFYAPDPHKQQASLELENWCQKGIRGCGELKATLNWNSVEMKSFLKTVAKLNLPVVFHMEESRRYEIPYSDALYDKVLFYGLRTKRRIFQIPAYFLNILADKYTPLKNRTRSYFFPGYMLDFASLESTLKEYPSIKFIGHGLMFWKYIASDGPNSNNDLPRGPINGEGIIWRLLGEYPNLYADLSGLSGLNALTRDPQNAKRFLSLFEDKMLYGTDNFLKGQKEFLISLKLDKSTFDKICGGNACGIMDKRTTLEKSKLQAF